jgi:MFS family permease
VPSAKFGYRSLLRIPGAAAFFLTAAVGRVGIAMTGLGLVWLVHARTGSYSTAGLTTAGFALAEALIGPQLARLVDRYGQGRVLPWSVLAHGTAIAGVLASASPAALIGCATFAGAAVPQLGACSAARWAFLLRDERRGALPAAFSLESLANAAAFLLGPVLVTALGAAGDAAWATASAAALILAGGGALALQHRTAPRPALSARPAGPAGSGRSAGSARSGAPRAPLRSELPRLAAANLAIGLYFGTMGVSVSAFAVGHGVPGASAPIIAASGVSGLLAGWLYGLRPHRAPAHRQLVIAAAYLTAAGLLLPFAPSAPWLGAAVVITEAAVPPTLVLLSVMTERSADPAVLTQAMTWNNSASAAGSALAAAAAGRIADHLGASAAFALAPTAGLLLLAVSLTPRR